MKTNLLILIVLFITISACKKEITEEPKQPVKEIYIDAAKAFIKDYFYFKKGSYWVYKDSINQIFDTVKVEYSFNDLIDAPSLKGDTLIKYECLNTLMSHSQTLRRSYFSFNSIYDFGEYHTDIITYSEFFIINKDSLFIHGASLWSSKKMSAEKNVSINSFSFEKGFETPWFSARRNRPYNYYPIPDSTNLKITYAKDVGIIKRSIKNDTLHRIWELVDYKIVK